MAIGLAGRRPELVLEIAPLRSGPPIRSGNPGGRARVDPAVQHLVAFPQLVPLEFLEAAPRRHGHQLFGDQLLDPFGFRAPREMDALSPQESVTAMRRLIDTFGPNQSGKFYNYDGREYPW